MSDRLPPDLRRGRAAALNMASRYDRQETLAIDDGWPGEEDATVSQPTEVMVDRSRSILTRNRSPDVPFDRSINPYRGCEHGCIYCFARPTHAHLGLSPGLDFETKLVVKPRAAALLTEALAKPGYAVAPIAIGTNTDPYQPIEKQHRVMRQVLEVLWEHRHPVSITTKGSLILRDLDVLGPMGRAGLAHATVSLTTLENRLSRAMEPRAAAPARRLAMIKALTQAGVPVQVNTSPIVPGLTDHEIERLLEAAAAAGALRASYTTLRLPLEVSPLFRDWLDREMPDRAARVMGRVREMHGGRDYDPSWHRRLKGEGVHAQLIGRRFRTAARRLGLDRDLPRLRTDRFRVPPRLGDQLALGL
ncbi:MAG: PA0069 family radical SAM protein [Pseudomonadota bacterium]